MSHRVLLLSGYDAASHQRWRKGLADHLPEFEFTQLALPPRHFSWRIRGNSMSFAGLHRETLEADYQALLATSMVDLAALRGMVPALARLPTALYFHENQFAYPKSATAHASVEPQIVTLYSALCADRLVFNTGFNRDSFFAGAEQLLRKLPDLVPPGIVSQLQARASVIPVLLDDACFPPSGTSRAPNRRPQLIWNHRWEYDKNPALLLRALELLCIEYNGALPFTLHVVGQSFRQVPAEFSAIKQRLSDAGGLGQWGYLPSSEYRPLLQTSDIVLSSADHDFQGLSVLEAVAAGATPVVPGRQAYPEWFGASACYPVTGALEADAQAFAAAIAARLAPANPTPGPDLSALQWSRGGQAYQQLLQQLSALHRL
ncbi:tRNA-queuosine alpha-mannosyltransferase domain-containing protein [Gilvimarinus japonicus]|uniref:tRNA-queuosine alpha-mannosyltransferase n=1 Tax=Gilvimarinus japonicus TaxID=1796469 RepID=A0ABV7HMP2_9GAMM